ALALPGWWHAADLDPAPIGWMKLFGKVFAPVSWVFLVVWFFGFTRVSRRTKWKALALLALLAAAAFAAIDGFGLDAQLWPQPHFRWQPRPEARLEESLEEEAETPLTGLPKIDLTIDSVNDFPRFRGLFADGVVRPSELLDMKWESGRPREVWRHP